MERGLDRPFAPMETKRIDIVATSYKRFDGFRHLKDAVVNATNVFDLVALTEAHACILQSSVAPLRLGKTCLRPGKQYRLARLPSYATIDDGGDAVHGFHYQIRFEHGTNRRVVLAFDARPVLLRTIQSCLMVTLCPPLMELVLAYWPSQKQA